MQEIPKAEAAKSQTTNKNSQTMNLTDRTARRQRASYPPSDSDPTSSSGSSSEDSSESESENEDEHHSDQEMRDEPRATTAANVADPSSSSLPHIGGRPKPRIHRMKGDTELLSRLNAFLPQMKTANEHLQKEIEAGRVGDLVLDNADEGGEQYIEMVYLLRSLFYSRTLLIGSHRILVLVSWRKRRTVIHLVRTRMIVKRQRIRLKT